MSVTQLPMRDALLERVWQEMSSNELIFFVSADFGSPVLDKIRRDFPNRFVNVGIAEQNLINITSGLAIEGYTVFAYAIAPFITMRCYEQIRVNLALLSQVRPINVNLIGVGAGYSYVVSGPTHQCYEDITIMRALPNCQILSPADHVAASALIDNCASIGLRYFRLDAQTLPVVYKSGKLKDVSNGFCVHQDGDRVCLVATGFMLHTAFEIASKMNSKGYCLGVIDLFDLTNFSDEEFTSRLKGYSAIISCEEGFSGRGGMDAMLLEFVAKNNIDIRVFSLGVRPEYNFELGSRLELHEKAGIGIQSALKKVHNFLKTI